MTFKKKCRDHGHNDECQRDVGHPPPHRGVNGCEWGEGAAVCTEVTSISWAQAAVEVQDEAWVRGDLDERTVHALVRRLQALGKGVDVPHAVRMRRMPARQIDDYKGAPYRAKGQP